MPKNAAPDFEVQQLALRFAGVNQANFAREFNVPGGASMVSQHVHGRRPMNIESAIAYATGFKCALQDISPRLADQVLRALPLLQPGGGATTTRPTVMQTLEHLSSLLTALPTDQRAAIGKLLDAFAIDGGSAVYLPLLEGKLTATNGSGTEGSQQRLRSA
jgi:hypothetical protein